MGYTSKNSDTIDGFTRIHGVKPAYKLCNFRSTNRRGTNRYYFDFYVFDEAAGKLMRKVRWMTNNLRKEKALLQAKPMMQKIDELLVLGYHLPNLNRIDRISFIDAVEMYLEYKNDRLSTQKNLKTIFMTYLLPYAKDNWQGYTLKDVGKAEIKKFLDLTQQVQQWTNQTRNSKKHLISDMFKYFMDLDAISENPCRRVRNEKANAIVHYEVFNKKQLDTLFVRLMQENKQVFVASAMIYYCFIRPNELRHVRVGHIAMEEKRIALYSEHTKNKKTHRIYMPARLREILEWSGYLNYNNALYLFGRYDEPGKEQIAYHKIRRKLKDYLDEIGLGETHSLYCFKPTGICNMYRKSKDLMAIKERGRFSSLEIAEIYLSRYNMLYKDDIDFE